jgi:hypothetical protein
MRQFAELDSPTLPKGYSRAPGTDRASQQPAFRPKFKAALFRLDGNFTPIGPKQPAFVGGVVLNHSLNGVPEYALGITPWLELGAYLPLYSITGEEQALIDGAKLRALFVSPNAAEWTFWYGVNFELSYNARHWQEARYALEIRPILGWRFGPVDLLLNPIIDFPFHGGPGALTFAPADRITYNLS